MPSIRRLCLTASIVAACILATGLAAAGAASAAEAQIAVAANFAAPMKALIRRFEADTDHSVRASFGSTGKLYAQIKNGAPFGVLLAADQERPALLEQEGLGVPGTRFTYAVGTLVLWSAEPGVIGDGAALLRAGDFDKLAIANPRLAPYGEASVQTMDALGVKAALEPKLVMGESIAQTYQFVATGNAEAGLVALSQVMRDGESARGSGWIVPGDLHEPIRQDALILDRGRDNAAVNALFEYLKGEKARAVIRDFGYRMD